MQLRGRKQAVTAGGAVIAMALLAACSSSSSSSSTTGTSPTTGGASSSSSAAAASGTINASGSTFQTNFQQAAIATFKQSSPGITVNYGGGGSGKGRSDLAAGTVQFAGSDTAPIPDKEMANLNGKEVLYFPVQVRPIAVACNLSGVIGLELDGPTPAGIFQGTLHTAHDPAMQGVYS